MGEEPGSWPSALDRARGQRRLMEALAPDAGQPWANVPLDHEARRVVLQLLTDVLAQALQTLTAIGAPFSWSEDGVFAGKVSGQRAAPGCALRESVEVKLLTEDGELYIPAQSRARIFKERGMRQRRLWRLWRRLHELRGQSMSRDELLLKVGAAKKEAGRAYHLVDIRLPPAGEAVTAETFTFEGRSVRDVAEAMGRSYGTVRWHMKHIFAKLGISRQVELVRAVLSLVGLPASRR